jgi:hypothetical protein
MITAQVISVFILGTLVTYSSVKAEDDDVDYDDISKNKTAAMRMNAVKAFEDNYDFDKRLENLVKLVQCNSFRSEIPFPSDPKISQDNLISEPFESQPWLPDDKLLGSDDGYFIGFQ